MVGMVDDVRRAFGMGCDGRVRMLGFPFRASGTPASIRRPAPLLGEHTAEVLTEILELTPAEVSALAESGAIRLGPPP